MLIKELTWQGMEAWPPQWSNSSHSINENAVLTDARPIIGTDLLRIDVDHNGIPYLGLLFVEKEVRSFLHRKLKENLGRRLVEIADLELDLELGAGDIKARAKQETGP